MKAASTEKSTKDATPKKAARSPFSTKALHTALRDAFTSMPLGKDRVGYIAKEVAENGRVTRDFLGYCYNLVVTDKVEHGGFGSVSVKLISKPQGMAYFYAGPKPKGEVLGCVRGPVYGVNDVHGNDLLQLLADAFGWKLVDGGKGLDNAFNTLRADDTPDTADVIELVRSEKYVDGCVRAVLTHRPGMAKRWADLEGKLLSEKALLKLVTESFPVGTALQPQPLNEGDYSVLCAGHHHPELLPRKRFNGAWCNGAWLRGDDLTETVAEAMGIQLPHHKMKATRSAMVVATPVPLWKPFPDHPGTTIPKDYKDPEFKGVSDWSHYPVLQPGNYETHTLKVSERIYAKAKVGLQDGIPVMGYDWLDMSGGGGCAPGRKWGEFTTLKDAEIYAWEHLQGNIDERVRMGSDSAKVKQDLRKLLQMITVRLAILNGDIEADADPTATGLQLQLPSTAPLPAGYAKAKDLKPGMVVIPTNRAKPHVVKSVELYGKSCSVMFEGNYPGMNVNPLQPVKLVQVQHVAIDADASPETVAAVREVVAKAYAHKPVKKAPGIGPKLKRKLGYQGGDVLPDGSMVVDPTKALLELHDQANGTVATPPATAPTPEPEAQPPGQLMERKPGQAWKPVATTAHTLSELAAPFGNDRREREVVKKRFRSMFGKLSTWPADQRRAFIQYITNILN